MYKPEARTLSETDSPLLNNSSDFALDDLKFGIHSSPEELVGKQKYVFNDKEEEEESSDDDDILLNYEADEPRTYENVAFHKRFFYKLYDFLFDPQSGFCIPGRDFQSSFTHHKFTPAELAQMNNYESLDYHVPQSIIYRQYLRSKSKIWYWRKEVLRWFLFCVVGIVVGLIVFTLKQSIQFLSEIHFTITEVILDHQSSLNKAFAYPLAWMAFVGYSLVLTVLSSSIVLFIAPAAAGSGLPEVIGYCNGVILPKIFNIRTLIVKFVSCVLAVSSGLPVGPEGPIIHMGAMIGGNLTQGRSKTLNWTSSVLTKFRNTEDRRDFISGGAAAGVAAAFGAPIGGLLFVKEEVASFWSAKLSLLIFSTCLFATFVIKLFSSSFVGWRPSGPWKNFGSFSDENSILFAVNIVINMHALTVVPAVILGLICGVLGSVFTLVNVKISRFRFKILKSSNLARLAEVVVVTIIFSSLVLFLPLTLKCENLPSNSTVPFDSSSSAENSDTGNQQYKLFQHTCSNPKKFSPLGTLLFNVGDEAIRHLFSRGTGLRFDYPALFVFLIVYSVFACYSAGMAISSGWVMPTLVIGATIGRIVGIAFSQVLDIDSVTLQRDYSYLDPGVFAMIGAASFLGGVSRLSVALAVIMTELSNDIHFLIPVSVGVIVAKSVGDLTSHSLYHSMLEIKSVPFLNSEPAGRSLDCFVAKDVMSNDVVCLPVKIQICELIQILSECRHNSFPVIVAQTQLNKQRSRERRLSMSLSNQSIHSPIKRGSKTNGHKSQPRTKRTKNKEKVNNESDFDSMSSNSSLNSSRSSVRGGGSGFMERSKIFKGMILRSQLEILLTHSELFLTREQMEAGRYEFFNDKDKNKSLRAEFQREEEREKDEVRNNQGKGVRIGFGLNRQSSLSSGEWEKLQDRMRILDFHKFKEEDGPHRSPVPNQEKVYKLEDLEDANKWIDLTPYMNTSVITVTENFALGLLYNIFRSMGLRHLPVLDEDNCVVGIITRKDLLGQTMEEKLREQKRGVLK